MGFFDSLKKQVRDELKKETSKTVESAVSGASKAVGKSGNVSETYTFSELPENLAALCALPEATLDSPYKTAALVIAALCRFEKDENAVHEMLDFLKGPEDLSNMEKQFLRDRLVGKTYKCYSFFAGASPKNDYTPERPYRITVSTNPYSFETENWATVYVQSGGADAPRPIKLRKKPSSGQWFLNDIQCLSDIRLPEAADPWA